MRIKPEWSGSDDLGARLAQSNPGLAPALLSISCAPNALLQFPLAKIYFICSILFSFVRLCLLEICGMLCRCLAAVLNESDTASDPEAHLARLRLVSQ